MYRFSQGSKLKSKFSGIYVMILIFVVLFFVFLHSLGSITEDTLSRQEESLNVAINRSIVSCYCVEGTYPPSLQYLKDHYGLTYDDETFFVDYTAIGSNIYPDVTVIRRKGGE